MPHLLQELQRRGVFQVAAMYAAVAFIVLQVADLTFPALLLSEAAYRILVWVVLAGFPVALIMAWFFDITPARARAGAPENVSAPRDFPPRRRYQLMSIVLILVLLTGVGAVSAVRARLGAARAADGRVALAVFPFRAVGDAGGEWSEGIADLLSTALDGTEGMRVLDPWSLWRDLKPSDEGPLTSPDPKTASALTRKLGGRRVILGSVVHNGDRAEINVRIYDPRFSRPVHTFAVAGARAQMSKLVESLAVGIITRVWDGETMPGAARLEPNATHSPEALKAYLAAKAAMRRGWVDSAANAIDKAIALDSTFSLALGDAVAIRSWHQFMTGRPYFGLTELLERAMAHDDSLSERSRLRLVAMQASVNTDGITAVDALRRILEIDSLDVAAWSSLSYVQNTMGWQYGDDSDDALASANRLLALDPSYVPGLVMQSWLALATDSPHAARSINRLAQTDTSVTLSRSTMRALRMLSSPRDTFELVMDRVLSAPFADWVAPLRLLRTYDPERAAVFLAHARERAKPGLERNAILWTHARLLVAEGRFRETAELMRGDVDTAVTRSVQRLVVASSLAGVGDSVATRRSVRELQSSGVGSSSWWTTWLLGAHHAQFGDVAGAVRAQRTIAQLPESALPTRLRTALQEDIEARLAARSKDATRATAHARRAYELSPDHTENQPETMPDPAFRFHLAMLLKSAGDTKAAEPLLRSLVAPANWQGFYTARASFELGELAAVRNDTAAARRHYTAALRYWSHSRHELASWREQAERGLARVSPSRL